MGTGEQKVYASAVLFSYEKFGFYLRGRIFFSSLGIFFTFLFIFFVLEFNSLTAIFVKQLCSQLLSTSSKTITTAAVIHQPEFSLQHNKVLSR